MTEPDEKRKNASNFARYSSISFQMLATIGVFAFTGYKIDERRNADRPILTALFSLVGVILSLYQVVRQLNKRNKD